MIGVLFSSFASIFVRLSDAHALAIATYRMWLSFFLLAPLIIIDLLRKKKTRTKIAGINGRDVVLCAISGFFLAAHFAMWIQSLGMTSIASATVLVDTHPMFVLTAGYLFLRERINRRAFACVLVAFLGIVLLSSGDMREGTDSFSGDLLALGGAAALAGYILIGRVVRQRMAAVHYAAIVYFFSSLVLTSASIAWRVPLRGYPAKELLIFLAMAFFCTILGHTVFNWALKYLKASFVSTAGFVEPVYATLLGIIIFGEIPRSPVFIGGGIILIGILLFVREEGKMQNITEKRAHH